MKLPRSSLNDYYYLLPLLRRTKPNLLSPQHSLPSPPHLQGTEVEPKCCSLPSPSSSTSWKTSLNCSRWRCHYSSEGPLFRHWTVEEKSQKRRRLLPHRLKAHRKPPEWAETTISTNTLLLVVCYYALRSIPRNFQMLFLFHPSVGLHFSHN